MPNKIYWTNEKISELINICQNRIEFKKLYNVAYQAAVSRKILDELFKNHKNNGYILNQWTIDKLQTAANKYNTRQEFFENEITRRS